MIELGHNRTNFQVLIEEPEYKLGYHVDDLGNGRKMAFLHIDVEKFSLAVMRKMKRQWLGIRQTLSFPLFAMNPVSTKTWERFIQHFGFKLLYTGACSDGQSRPIFIHI